MQFDDEFKKYIYKYFDGKAIRQSDDLTVIIRGHLLVETALIVLLSQHLKLEAFEDRDLTFDFKLKLAQSMNLLGNLFAPIKRLNNIRNDFAHKIETKIEDIDISVFTDFIKKKHLDNNPVFNTYVDEKKLYLGQVISYVLGSLSNIIEGRAN